MKTNSLLNQTLAAQRYASLNRRRFLRGLGACLALPQAILLHRKFGRAMAIRWGAWAAAACIAGWLIVASELPEILGWEDLDSSLDGSLDQALLGLVFSALTCPALKRLLAARATSR